MNILSWNINGVKQKFANTEVVDVFRDHDILIVTESHFDIRVTCPDGFMLCGRSKVVEAKKPRGGVAVYRNIRSGIDIDILNDAFRDTVVFRIRDTKLVIAAMYIPGTF